MAERAARLGGTLEVISAVGEGTRVKGAISGQERAVSGQQSAVRDERPAEG